MGYFAGVMFLVALVSACGKAKDTINEVQNEWDVKGHWLMTESINGSAVEKALEKESMVLTFKDGKAVFEPTNSVKGKAVYATLSKCVAGPRPYRAAKNQFVFEPVAGCGEIRIEVNALDSSQFRFADPDKPTVIRTFRRIDEPTYVALVKS